MSQYAQKIIDESYRSWLAMLLLVIGLYTLGFTAHLYQQQYNEVKLIEAALVDNSSLKPSINATEIHHSLLPTSAGLIQVSTFELDNSQAIWPRVVKSANTQILFESPIILVVSNLAYWLAILLNTICFILYRKLQTRLIFDRLSEVTELETWARHVSSNGDKALPEGSSAIANAIKAAHQIALNKNDQSSQFDQILREKALIDPETKIGNRAFLNNRLEAILKASDVRGVMMLIQLQDAELIQKLHGEVSAHQLLMKYIAVIKHRFSHLANYYLARRNDYELAVLLPGLYVNEAIKLSDRLINNLNNIELPVGVDKEAFIHIGVSFFNANNSAYQIMAEADMALRSAQLQGPSQWFMFDKNEVVDDLAKGSLKWRTFLESAINNNAFVMFFQPVISDKSGEVLHHEVLAKVRDECGELISGRVFFPMARKCGLTPAIDRLVFEQVSRVLSYEQRKHESCSLNLSIESLLSSDFQQYLLTHLSEQPSIARKLIVEVSEYHLVAQLEEIAPFLQNLYQAGVKLLVDKVGQYVENANYLKVCPFSYVKLHGSIVIDLPEKPENQLFIQSLKTMCDYHGVEVYALGVESKEEWLMLCQLGVSGGQGHYFTEPVVDVSKAIQFTY